MRAADHIVSLSLVLQISTAVRHSCELPAVYETRGNSPPYSLSHPPAVLFAARSDVRRPRPFTSYKRRLILNLFLDECH